MSDPYDPKTWTPGKINGSTHPSWWPFLNSELGKPYMQDLRRVLAAERDAGLTYPPLGETFAALQTPLHGPSDYAREVSCVIVGQDPYHGPGQAHGLAFSVRQGVRPPPSLRVVLDELRRDCGVPQTPTSGDLSPWARAGVLLLNTVLTVRDGSPGSHRAASLFPRQPTRDRDGSPLLGWERFTSAIMAQIVALSRPIVWLAWGADARQAIGGVFGLRLPSPTTHDEFVADSASRGIRQLQAAADHVILTAPHPSPLSSSPFIGCAHFTRANRRLEMAGVDPIDWRLS